MLPDRHMFICNKLNMTYILLLVKNSIGYRIEMQKLEVCFRYFPRFITFIFFELTIKAKANYLF